MTVLCQKNPRPPSVKDLASHAGCSFQNCSKRSFNHLKGSKHLQLCWSFMTAFHSSPMFFRPAHLCRWACTGFCCDHLRTKWLKRKGCFPLDLPSSNSMLVAWRGNRLHQQVRSVSPSVPSMGPAMLRSQQCAKRRMALVCWILVRDVPRWSLWDIHAILCVAILHLHRWSWWLRWW